LFSGEHFLERKKEHCTGILRMKISGVGQHHQNYPNLKITFFLRFSGKENFRSGVFEDLK